MCICVRECVYMPEREKVWCLVCAMCYVLCAVCCVGEAALIC